MTDSERPIPANAAPAALVEAQRAVLSTERVNRAATEASVAGLFDAARIPVPKRIVWCGGPLEISRAREKTGGSGLCGPSLLPALFKKMSFTDLLFEGYSRHPTPDAYRQLVGKFQLLRRSIAMHLAEDDARFVLGGWLRRFVGLLRQKRHPAPWNTIELSGLSQFDAAFLDSQQQAAEGTAAEMLRHARAITHGCGWFVPHHGTIWLSDRPTDLSVDDRNRLHRADGPALAYRDGWRVHAWKGVRLPARLIDERQSLTVADIHHATDPVIRRCMIEIMTPEKFIAAGGALIISKDDTGILWHRRWRSDAWSAVEVVNGTRDPDGTFRHYFLQVPADMRTARQAVAWTYHMSERQYARLDIRT